MDRESTLLCNRLQIMDTPKIDLRKLGYRVRELRLGRGWTLSDLAKRSGVSKAYISDLENGVAGKPNIQYIFSVARALGVTLDEMLHNVTGSDAAQSKKASVELPPGLAELQEELKLSDDDVQRLATVSFRGHRPRDKEGWRFLLETLQMLSQRKLQK